MATFGEAYSKRKSYVMVKARRNNTLPEYVEYSHYGLCSALLAGQMGVPFMVNRTQLGTDVEKQNDNIRRMECPFTGETVGIVGAINPDVGIIHVQRSDAEGNAQKWGSLGMDVVGINASRTIIVTTEKIVNAEVIRKDPNRTIIPGVRVRRGRGRAVGRLSPPPGRLLRHGHHALSRRNRGRRAGMRGM